MSTGVFFKVSEDDFSPFCNWHKGIENAVSTRNVSTNRFGFEKAFAGCVSPSSHLASRTHMTQKRRYIGPPPSQSSAATHEISRLLSSWLGFRKRGNKLLNAASLFSIQQCSPASKVFACESPPHEIVASSGTEKVPGFKE